MSEEIKKENVKANSDDNSNEDVKVKKDDGMIARHKFNEANDKRRLVEKSLKEAQTKLEEYQTAEKKKQEDKLLEEKNFDAVLKAKELEIEGHKIEVESLKKSASLEKIKSKIVNLANKEGAIDAEDILRFISVDDLLAIDAEKLSEELKQRMSKIKENKAHLFTITKRDGRENGMPYLGNTSDGQPKKNMTLNDRIEESLRRSHKR